MSLFILYHVLPNESDSQIHSSANSEFPTLKSASTASHTSTNWGEILTNSTSYSCEFYLDLRGRPDSDDRPSVPTPSPLGRLTLVSSGLQKKKIAQLLPLKAQFQIFGRTWQNNLELCDKRASFHASKATIYIYQRVWMSRDNISL